MEVNKLYYQDSHIKTFQATVTDCRETDAGWDIILDATAFYPEGGGQPCDTGSLGESRVLSVREADGAVIHLCDKPIEIGRCVTGAVDWDRRFDFMQQHSGEHMVSGIVHRQYGYHNVGFHMGEDTVTVDFDGPISPADLQKIEDRANDAIWENLPVLCYYPSREELPSVPYRRKKDLPWPVRIVEIPGIDLCACCGTQVKHTGQIGLVKLLSCVKFHDGVRIEMACGKRALNLLNTAYCQNRLVSQAFSAKPQETGAAAERINLALAGEKHRAASLEKQLFACIAKTYRGKALALHFEQDLTPAANRELCDAIARYAEVAVTLCGTDASGYSLCIISHTRDARTLGQKAAAALGGKGGGKKEAFQGRLPAKREKIVHFFLQENNAEK